VGCYKKFIKYFNKLTSPLFTLLSKNAKFCWSSECQKAYDNIKEILMKTFVLQGKALVLQGPKWDIPIYISMGSFDRALGVVLG
jgi:hypothetical protein